IERHGHRPRQQLQREPHADGAHHSPAQLGELDARRGQRGGDSHERFRDRTSGGPGGGARIPRGRRAEARAGGDAARARHGAGAESRVRAADRVVDDDWKDYSPFLVGNAQAFYQNPASLSVPTTGWQAQLILTVPFYDGGLRYGLAQEREALRNEARAQLQGS